MLCVQIREQKSLHALTACSGNGEVKFQWPNRTGKRRRHPCPVASWKSEHDFHFHIRVSAQARVLASSFLAALSILFLSSINVLLFSLLLLLTASYSFLSRQSHIPTLCIPSPTLPLRLSLAKTPRSFLLLMMSSASLRPPPPRLLPYR